jgi:hypothetical protein
MLSGSDAWHIVVEVSLMDFGAVDHENGTLRTAMKNGNSIMMRFQQ